MQHGQLVSHVDTDLVSRAELSAAWENSCMREDLAFHIERNDYFGTLATVLDLLRQDLIRHGHNRHTHTLAHLRDELVELQHSHRIHGIGRGNQDRKLDKNYFAS